MTETVDGPKLVLGSCPDSWGVWFADDPKQTPWTPFLDELADVGYEPLGAGDVDVSAIVLHLRGRGYDGWDTLEQDTILTGEPQGEGPVADVRTSAEYLRSLLRSTS